MTDEQLIEQHKEYEERRRKNIEALRVHILYQFQNRKDDKPIPVISARGNTVYLTDISSDDTVSFLIAYSYQEDTSFTCYQETLPMTAFLQRFCFGTILDPETYHNHPLEKVDALKEHLFKNAPFCNAGVSVPILKHTRYDDVVYLHSVSPDNNVTFSVIAEKSSLRRYEQTLPLDSFLLRYCRYELTDAVLLEKNTSLLDAVMCNARSAPAYTVSTVLSGKDRIVCVFFAGEKMIAYLEINQKNGVQTKVHVDWIGIDYVGESDATFAYVFRDMQPLESSPFLGLNISEAIRLARTDNRSKFETILENAKIAKPNTVNSILRGFNPQYNCIETVFAGPVTDESITVMVFYRTDPEFIYKAAGLYTIETLTPDEFESRFADYFFLSKEEFCGFSDYDEYFDIPFDRFQENLLHILLVHSYGQIEPEERELVEYHVSGELFTPFTTELKPMAFFDNHWFSPSYRFLYHEKDRTE